jgi:hypothetical protein
MKSCDRILSCHKCRVDRLLGQGTNGGDCQDMSCTQHIESGLASHSLTRYLPSGYRGSRIMTSKAMRKQVDGIRMQQSPHNKKKAFVTYPHLLTVVGSSLGCIDLWTDRVFTL